MKTLSRQCSICNYSYGEILHTQKFVLPAGHPLPDQYDVVACSNCGNCFVDTPVTQSGYDLFYKSFSKYEDKQNATGTGIAPFEVERFDRVVTFLNHFLPDKKAGFLDIGSANGGLLLNLRKWGYTNLTGLDPSKSCVETTRSLGFRAYEGGLFDIENVAGNTYDCIVLSHVLEHIEDVNTCIRNVMSLLSGHGVFYIEVPDAGRYKDYYVAPYHYFDLEHINHFDLHSLNRLMANYGFIPAGSDSKEICVNGYVTYPALGVAYTRGSHRPKMTELTGNIKDYIQRSHEKNELSELEHFVSRHQEAAVWGLGAYGLRLLESTITNKIKVVALLDQDQKKHDTRILNIPVQAPGLFLSRHKTMPVIITSALYSEEIKHEIHHMDGHKERPLLVL